MFVCVRKIKQLTECVRKIDEHRLTGKERESKREINCLCLC